MAGGHEDEVVVLVVRRAVAGLHSVSVLAAKRAVLRPDVGLGRRLPPSGHRTVRRQARRRLQCSQEKPGPWGTAHCLLGHSLGRDGLEARGMRRWGLIDAGHRPQQGHHDESIRVDRERGQPKVAQPLSSHVRCTTRVTSGPMAWACSASSTSAASRTFRGHIQAEWQCARALVRQGGIVAAYGRDETGSETARGRTSAGTGRLRPSRPLHSWARRTTPRVGFPNSMAGSGLLVKETEGRPRVFRVAR